ncbi:PAS domain-containing protein [Brevirhabdus sp.]|uniref:PAS domain-containing protein n=1 Tax=Brevirhabdus sp. TaxID=2004514 RepID=UPI00405818B2
MTPLPPPLATLRSYWASLRADPAPPRRSQLDLRLLGGHAVDAFLLGRVTGAPARLRLGNPALSALSGMEVRGTPFAGLFRPACRTALHDVLGPVLVGEAQAVLHLSGDAAQGLMLLLPLARESDRQDAALGGVAFDAPARKPCRLRLDRAVVLPLPAIPAALFHPAGLAEEAAPFRPAPRQSLCQFPRQFPRRPPQPFLRAPPR